MKWLHISDLHFHLNNGGGTTKHTLDKLTNYLSDNGIKADMLFITGDFRFAGIETEENNLKVAEEIAKYILYLANIIGVIPENIHIVPGNHDLHRKQPNRWRILGSVISDYCSSLKELDLEKAIIDLDAKKAASEAFGFFAMLLDKMFGADRKNRILREMEENIHYAIPFSSFNLLLLNTAIVSYRKSETEHGSLILGHKNIDLVLSRLKENGHTANPTFVLAHHPLNSFHYAERRLIWDYFASYGVCMYLCGHSHELHGTIQDNIMRTTQGSQRNEKGMTISFTTGEYNEQKMTIEIAAYSWLLGNWNKENHFGSKNEDFLKIRSRQSDFSTHKQLRILLDAYDRDKITEKVKGSFIKYLNTLTKSHAISYILSGLTENESINDRITPRLFYDEFYVSNDSNSNKANEKDTVFDNNVTDLFDDEEHNLMCIIGDAGTGKTTLIKTLACRYEKENAENYKYIVLDCAKASSNLGESSLFPHADILQRFRKEMRQMARTTKTGNYQWQSLYIQVLHAMLYESEITESEDIELERFIFDIELVLDEIDNSANEIGGIIKRYSKISHSIMGNITEFTKMALYLLLLTCKNIVYYENKLKYIVTFDNIEAYTNSTAITVGDKYSKIIEKLNKLYGYLCELDCFRYNSSNYSVNFIRDFTFIISARPTTNCNILSSIQSRHLNKYTIVREYYDFSVEALLRKLIFLKSNCERSQLFEEVKRVVSLLIPKKVVNKYLKDGSYSSDSGDVKYYMSKKYLPFFNNNFRNAINNLDNLYKDNSVIMDKNLMDIVLSFSDEKSSVIEDKNQYISNIKINAARIIIFKDVFDRFIKCGHFQIFGISVIAAREKKFSITRMIIAYIYWKQAVAAEKNDVFNGVSISTIVEVFSNTYSREEVISVLIKLSRHCELDDKKKDAAILEWGYFVDFTRGIRDNDIKKSLTPQNDSIIDVKLTPTGYCYADYVSVQFEFFSARIHGIPRDPLILYGDSMNGSNYDFEVIIDRVFDSVCDFADGLVTIDKKRECDEDHRNCQVFLRSQELCGVITSHIDYIDRFRCLLWHKYRNNAINETILKKIKNYNGLFSKAREIVWDRSKCKNNFIKLFVNRNKEYPSEATKYFFNDEYLTDIQFDKVIAANGVICDQYLYNYISNNLTEILSAK